MDFRSWAFLAALFAFAAVFVGRERVFSRLKEYEEEKQKKREYVPALSLVLEMIAVAVGQGASIPRALEAISHSMPGVFSQFAGEIVSVLYKGGDWAGAWAVVPGNCPYRAFILISVVPSIASWAGELF